MIKAIRHILTSVVTMLLFIACDVHEFPETHSEKVPFTLHLDFSTEMPLYKEIFYTRSGEIDPETKAAAESHDIRYIIQAYPAEQVRNGERSADAIFIFSKHDLENLNYTANIELPEGEYTFLVWADYVDAGSIVDKYYDTSDFAEIILASKKPHIGNTDYRDAFRGQVSASVINPDYYSSALAATISNEATVKMVRPMGKYKFVSNDVEIFLTRVAEMLREQGKLIGIDPNSDPLLAYEKLLEQIDLGEYQVIFRYNAFMPCSFNMFTNKPADSWTGITYASRMRLQNDGKMSLGFDYIFVNGNETTLSISVAVYNKDGVEISSSNSVNVPIVRSKLTLVSGEFLTSKSTGGVSIDPSYEGEDINIEIK